MASSIGEVSVDEMNPSKINATSSSTTNMKNKRKIGYKDYMNAWDYFTRV